MAESGVSARRGFVEGAWRGFVERRGNFMGAVAENGVSTRFSEFLWPKRKEEDRECGRAPCNALLATRQLDPEDRSSG
jgi:hypothetical protein